MNKIKINTKAIIVTLVASSSLMFASCSDWLNVKPSNQTIAEEQFSKEEGFKTALSGVYTLLAQPEMYGREMTFGAVDYLGQYWKVPATYAAHFTVASYDFESTKALAITDKIWNKSYNAIANINDLLAFVDVKRNVFSSEMTYSVVKGEALALRAYVHFDMLRLFAPNTFDQDVNSEKWLPYVDVYSRDTKLSLTNKEFADKVLVDLKAAAELLKQDPIFTGIASSDTYFKNRNFHINYYAVRALMARVYLYIGDTANAKIAAKEVIDAQNNKELFRWVTVDEVTYEPASHSDRTFSTEHIFALNVHKLGDNIKTFFINYVDVNSLALSVPASTLFEGENEFRARFVDANNIPTKFLQPEKEYGNLLEQKLKRIPLIRISEMYYILAECDQDVNYLNIVRANRGIESDLPGGTDIKNAITSEVAKEFIGEGQRFFYHKRIGSNQITSGYQYSVRYTLVMPENEINFGGRPRPTE